MGQQIVVTTPDIPKYRTYSPRQPEYGDDIREEILNRMRNGETLNQICRDPHMPDVKLVSEWRSKDAGFARQYALAREEMIECWGSQILDIADDSTRDKKYIETKHGPMEVVDHEVTKRSELRINTRKWLMSKLRPERYGDKLEVQNNVNVRTEQLKTLEQTMSELTAEEYEALSILIDNRGGEGD